MISQIAKSAGLLFLGITSLASCAIAGTGSPTDNDAPVVVTSPIPIPPLPPGFESIPWSDVESALSWTENLTNIDASRKIHKRDGHICGPATNVPVGDCATLAAEIIKAGDAQIYVGRGGCLARTYGRCRGILCANLGGPGPIITTAEWVGQELSTLYGYCVLAGGGEQGFAFDCYSLTAPSCGLWGVYMTNS